MSHNLLALAGATNEAAIAYRNSREGGRDQFQHLPALVAADRLAGVVDELTGAVVEHANEAPIEVPLASLTRLREVEEVAAHLGKSVPAAIVWLVNSALSSASFAEGYQHALDVHGIVETPPAEVGDGYAHDEPERDQGGRTELPEHRLVEIRALGKSNVGRFVDPTVVGTAGKILDRRGETWAASILGRDISARSPGVPNRPALREGEEYALVFADAAEDRHALGLEQ